MTLVKTKKIVILTENVDIYLLQTNFDSIQNASICQVLYTRTNKRVWNFSHTIAFKCNVDKTFNALVSLL